MEEFWIQSAEVYSDEKFEINELGTHPLLVESFNKYDEDWTSILDYGCGDGSLMQKLKRPFEISLFDTSSSMLSIAEKKLRHLNLNVYDDAKLLPRSHFDCIFLSMVLVCVDSATEIEFIIDRLFETKKDNGLVFVANPHPCFRDRPFSSYYTEYTIGKTFNYFDDGDRHKIFIRGKPMKFFDYNWSISFVINAFRKRGLNLVEMIEAQDNDTNEEGVRNEFYNKRHSPSIVYIFK